MRAFLHEYLDRLKDRLEHIPCESAAAAQTAVMAARPKNGFVRVTGIG